MLENFETANYSKKSHEKIKRPVSSHLSAWTNPFHQKDAHEMARSVYHKEHRLIELSSR